MRQPRLFISSSLADRSVTSKLADYLRRAYDEVWYDVNRYGGEVWWEDILWNIKACDIFIYLLSPTSVVAAYCRAEYAEAQRLRKQILPVIIRADARIPPELANLQPIDLSHGLTAAKVGELLAALKQLENQFPKAPPVPSIGERTPVPSVTHQTPGNSRLRIAILAMFGILLVLAALMILFGPTDPALRPNTLIPTTADVLPSSTAISPSDTPVPPTVMTPSDTPVPPTVTYTASASSTPGPTSGTSTSTVPPTVTRRFTATRRR